jgi:hypothetical protein
MFASSSTKRIRFLLSVELSIGLSVYRQFDDEGGANSWLCLKA